MKRRMIRYMLDREISPMEFSELVNFSNENQHITPLESLHGQSKSKNITFIDMLMITAVIAVSCFFLLILMM